ncbi:MAG TPA: MFS transporter [Acidimicrobiales bacterium]|nr:MFS transporter [Acidimicrobiales bacterium]
MAPPPAGPAPRPLAAFRPLAMAWLLLGSVEWVVGVALTVELYESTGSATWVAAGAVLRFLPLFLLSPLAGVVADRMDRRRLLAITSGVRVGLLAALALLVVVDAPPILLLALATLDATAATPMRPTSVALVPQLVAETRLARANAILAAFTQATWLIGPGVAAVSLRAGGAGLAFAGSAVMTALAVWSVASVPRVRSTALTHLAPPPPLRMLVDGVRTVRATPALLALLVLAAAVYLAFGVEMVVHVAVADERLGIGGEGVAIMTAAIGAGGLLGVWLAARLARGAAAGLSLAIGSLVLTLAVALLVLPRSLGPALVILVAEGVGNMVYDVLAMTTLQRLVPGRMLARVTALVETVQAGAQVIGSLAAPALIAATDLGTTLVVAGLGTTAVVLVALPALWRSDRSLAARRTALADQVAVLAGLPVFDGASLGALERVAEASDTVVVAPGEAVVRQGDAADHVYAVVTGSFDVRVDGPRGTRTINRLGPGDGFGEIGVLRRRLRTATVVATSPAAVWRIDAETFLEAVTLSSSTEHRIETMLARSDAPEADTRG